jgi:hypothetical protein
MLVYKYAARIVSGVGLIRDQLRMAHKLRNTYCELERARRAAVDVALAQLCPELLAVEQKLEALAKAIKDRETALGKLKSSGTKPTKAHREEMADLRAQGKAASQRRRELRKELWGVSSRAENLRKAASNLHGKPAETIAVMRGLLWPGCEEMEQALNDREAANAGDKRKVDDAIREALSRLIVSESSRPDVASRLGEIDRQHREAMTKARHESGLYWGTYLAVDDAASKFRSGAPPQFKRWSGDGLLAQQFSGGLDVQDAFRGTPQFSIAGPVLRGDGSSRPIYLVRMRVGPHEDDFATLHVVMHRPLPPEATIKRVSLVARRVASHDKWSLQLVLSGTPERDDRATSGTVAVDIGWRRQDTGIRVAYWIGDDGERGTLEVPNDQARRLPQCDELESIRDMLLDGAKAVLGAWRKGTVLADAPEWLSGQAAWYRYRRGGCPPNRLPVIEDAARCYGGLYAEWRSQPSMPEWIREASESCHAWRSQGRLASLVVRWRDNRFDGDWLLYGVFEHWRKQDKHLWEWSANNRRKFQEWRLDAYRVFARTLARRYKRLVIESVDWRKFSVKPTVEETDEMKLARRRKAVTSPSILESALENAFGKAGIERVSAYRMSTTCHVCGEQCGESDRWKLIYECSYCRSSWDQDRNACLNLLRAAACDPKSPETLATD